MDRYSENASRRRHAWISELPWSRGSPSPETGACSGCPECSRAEKAGGVPWSPGVQAAVRGRGLLKRQQLPHCSSGEDCHMSPTPCSKGWAFTFPCCIVGKGIPELSQERGG